MRSGTCRFETLVQARAVPEERTDSSWSRDFIEMQLCGGKGTEMGERDLRVGRG